MGLAQAGMEIPARAASPAEAAARRGRLLSTGLKLLLLLTMIVAYLNPILRASEDSILTAFRVLLPVVSLLVFGRFARYPMTHRFLAFIAIVAAYSLLQMLVFDHLSDLVVWSYLLNIVAVIAFIYFVCVYFQRFGAESLYHHLRFWYAFMVLASIHQLLTGFMYPNAPYMEGVARIYFGQENETSLALAAFVPLLLSRCIRDPLAALLLLAGVVIIFLNSTRGVLFAVAAYPVMVAIMWLGARSGKRIRVLGLIVFVALLLATALAVYLLRDVRLGLVNDEDATLTDLLIEPVEHMAAGQLMDAQLTSINLRVTLAIVGVLKYLGSFGFGIGPGAATYFVREYYSGIAMGMHIFPLQLLVECGWLFVGTMLWLIGRWARRIGWQRCIPVFGFFFLVTVSITGSAITNYYFYACAVCTLMSMRDNLRRSSSPARAQP